MGMYWRLAAIVKVPPEATRVVEESACTMHSTASALVRNMLIYPSGLTYCPSNNELSKKKDRSFILSSERH